METKWTGDGWRYPDLFKEWQQPGNFKFPFCLQPPRHYVGPAWYEKQIEIPESWKGLSAHLFLERVHWQSTIWIDGKKIGSSDSLGTAHEFDLGELAPGQHQFVIRVDNRLTTINPGPLSHSVTDHTQGNWNGIVGKMEIQPRPLSRITTFQVFPRMMAPCSCGLSAALSPARARPRWNCGFPEANGMRKRKLATPDR
ncbi:MAG: sugar-binding domain-containing protein [Verrucomicrobiales bacterium]